MALRGFVEAVEEGNIGGEEQVWWVNSTLGVGEEWSFEMDAEGFCSGEILRVLDEFCQAFERAKCGVDGSGDGGGQETAGAPAGEEFADGGEGFGGGFHYVVAGCAVDVDIEEGWGQGGRGKVDVVRAGGDGVICSRADGDERAVFDFEGGVGDEGLSIPELRGCDDGPHVGMIAGVGVRRPDLANVRPWFEWLEV